MIWLLSVMLVFADVDKPKIQYWQHLHFKDLWECRAYIAENKVNLTDSVLESFREYNGKKLKNYEFFCETKELPEV